MPRTPTPKQQLRTIRQSLAILDRAVKRLAATLDGAGGEPKRRLKLSRKRRAQLKLHGRYLGYVRQLKPRQKAKVKAIKAAKGYHAAIRMAKRMASV